MLPASTRVLVVDDDPTVLLIARRLFRRDAPHVDLVEAATGEDAIREIDSRDLACVVSDYRMGAVTGVQVLAHALARRPLARRVLMSGFADEATLRGAREFARIHEFVEKPLSSQDLEQALRDTVILRLTDGAGASTA